MATTTHNTRPSIGRYRKIRLRINPGGYYEIWWTDAEGSLTKRESCRTKVLAEAQAYLDNFQACAEAQVATVAAARPPTVEELCQAWLDYVEAAGKAETGRRVLATVRRELGQLTADQVDGPVLKGYAAARGVSQSTVRRELGALRTVLIWASDERRISRDDVPSFKRAMPPEGPPRSRFLDATQEQMFWAEAQRYGNPRLALFIALGLDTAARREAILDLTWDRVDLVQGTINFQKPGRRITKKRRVRGVPIARRLMPVLKEAWLRAPKDSAGQAIGAVVGGGTRISKPFARFAAHIGLPWVTPHVMRHTWGSLRAMEGIPLYDIARGMGDSVGTVERNYLHLTPDHLRRVFRA